MERLRKRTTCSIAIWALLGVCVLSSGCAGLRQRKYQYNSEVPSELSKAILPPYVISPPDVLQINAVQLIPLPPYKVKPLDVLMVQFPAQPELLKKEDLEALLQTGRVISGNFTVEPDGTINLGSLYGKVDVYDMTLEQAKETVMKKVSKLTNPELVKAGMVVVDLVQSRGMQQILGDHLVRPDGTITLGVYGAVTVTGLTVPEARAAIETHLSMYLKDPEISVEVSGYNSQVYYVIMDGGGFGEQVVRMPVTGSETVLDAIGQVQGLPAVASRRHIWIARPNAMAAAAGCPDGEAAFTDGIKLPVDWKAITRRGNTVTNYQLLPGDRLYVMAEPMITTNTYIDRFLAPIERLMGGTLLYTATYRSIANINTAFGIGGGGGF